ncbi:MAG: RsmE family RNA methyltransferase [Armatimonadetes bacterium]|nr:RsmE family RNA methyltransferase [Armatimonadota bacterium]
MAHPFLVQNCPVWYDLLPLHQPITLPGAGAPGDVYILSGLERERLRFRDVRLAAAFTAQDTAGRWWRVRLEGDGQAEARVRVFEPWAAPEPPAAITLMCAVLARERMFGVIQKATELGVMRIQPVITERSLAGEEALAREKAYRWPAVALRAVRQCRRAVVPEVAPVVPLVEALRQPWWCAADLRFYLDLDTAPEARAAAPEVRAVLLCAGPEGGWTPAERGVLAAAGAVPLALGGRVLRAETAALVGLALVMARWGDLAPGW